MAVVDSGYYESQRRGIDQGYAANMAANEYSRGLAQTRGSRDLSFMKQDFQRQTPSFSSSFAQRGFGAGTRSGVQQQAMQRYLGDFTQKYGYAQNDLTQQMQQFDLQSAQLGAQRTSSLADIELAKAREIAFAAQNIEALRQVLGGL